MIMQAKERKQKPREGWPVQIVEAPSCPACGCRRSKVRNSQPRGESCRWSLRKCDACETTFPVIINLA